MGVVAAAVDVVAAGAAARRRRGRPATVATGRRIADDGGGSLPRRTWAYLLLFGMAAARSSDSRKPWAPPSSVKKLGVVRAAGPMIRPTSPPSPFRSVDDAGA